jgi:excisionase family DNA binding protein
MNDRREYLRARGIAELLGESERTVRRRIKDGTFPSIKVGGARLVSKDVLLRVLRGNENINVVCFSNVCNG